MMRAPELCRRAGITYRQADYWDRTGLLSPSIVEANGSGTQRVYSERDLDVAIVLGYLSSQGPRTLHWPRRNAIAEHVRAHGVAGRFDLDTRGVITIDLDNLARVREPVAS